MRAHGRSAPPPASEKPNFWSSWAVAMNSWVCASTPTVTRTIRALATLPWRAASPALDLLEQVDDVAADAVLRASSSRRRSCCCRGRRSGRPGTRAHGQ